MADFIVKSDNFTIVEKKKAEAPKKGGHWKNVYFVATGLNMNICGDWIQLDAKRWMYKEPYPTREIAETNIEAPLSGKCACFFFYRDDFIWGDCIHFEDKA